MYKKILYLFYFKQKCYKKAKINIMITFLFINLNNNIIMKFIKLKIKFIFKKFLKI
jgi:hypothetical protein